MKVMPGLFAVLVLIFLGAASLAVFDAPLAESSSVLSIISADLSEALKAVASGNGTQVWFGSQGKLNSNNSCTSTNDHAFCPTNYFQVGIDRCNTEDGIKIGILCEGFTHEVAAGNGTQVWFGSQGKLNSNNSCTSTNDHAFCPDGYFEVGVDRCDNDGSIRMAVLCEGFTEEVVNGVGPISNLTSVIQSSKSISWNWTNPVNPDFNHTRLYLNNNFIGVTSGKSYTAVGLIPNTLYTLTVNTVDKLGNVNPLNVSNTNKTLASSIIQLEIVSPLNRTYNVSRILLNFTAANATGLYYILDNNESVNYLGAVLVNISEGGHNLSVTAYNNESVITKSVLFNVNFSDSGFTVDPISSLILAERTNHSLSWSWTNPPQEKFDHVLVYIDDLNRGAVFGNNFTLENLTQGSSHKITVYTVDKLGNVNLNGVSRTDSTLSYDNDDDDGGSHNDRKTLKSIELDYSDFPQEVVKPKNTSINNPQKISLNANGTNEKGATPIYALLLAIGVALLLILIIVAILGRK